MRVQRMAKGPAPGRRPGTGGTVNVTGCRSHSLHRDRLRLGSIRHKRFLFIGSQGLADRIEPLRIGYAWVATSGLHDNRGCGRDGRFGRHLGLRLGLADRLLRHRFAALNFRDHGQDRSGSRRLFAREGVVQSAPHRAEKQRPLRPCPWPRKIERGENVEKESLRRRAAAKYRPTRPSTPRPVVFRCPLVTTQHIRYAVAIRDPPGLVTIKRKRLCRMLPSRSRSRCKLCDPSIP